MSKQQAFKLLIVEDNPQTQNTLRSMFEVQEMEITIASNALDAKKIIDDNFKPHVIILDLNLPGISGGAFLERITKERKLEGTKVIPFSSTVNEKTNEAYQEAEPVVDEYLQALKLDQTAGNMVVSDIIPKYNGQEGVDVVHPKLIIAVAKELLHNGFELTPSFQHLVFISKKQIDRLKV